MSLFCCPICGAQLIRSETQYRCPNGHSYDRAKEGYIHLLPANRMHSKTPGDDKEMATARNRFLSHDSYAALGDALCALAVEYAQEETALLDSGCGEGYYTDALFHRLTAAGKKPCIAGVDLSKPSLKYAARRANGSEFAVASVYHLPVADRSIDLLVNCFSPLALDEFRRVLKENGIFFYVVPAADHLWELKQILYDQPYRNNEETTPYDGFVYEKIESVKTTLHLETQEVLQDLFRMTPYYWKTPKEGALRLSKWSKLDVTASFRIHVFRRTDASLQRTQRKETML